MDLVIGLPISTNWKDGTYDLILIILNKLTKIFYYKLLKVIIDIPDLVKVIINKIVRHHSLLDSIISD